MSVRQMQKEKRARRANRIEPVLSNLFGFHSRPRQHGRCGGRRLSEGGVEEREAFLDARFLAQQKRRDDAPGHEAAIPEHLRKQPFGRLEAKSDAVSYAGFERQATR